MIKRYKTKPCEIEAIEWNGSNFEEVSNFASGKVHMELYLVPMTTVW